MTERTCPKCNRTFDRKDAYEKHITKKFPCKPRKDMTKSLEQRIKENEDEIQDLKNKMEKLLKIINVN